MSEALVSPVQWDHYSGVTGPAALETVAARMVPVSANCRRRTTAVADRPDLCLPDAPKSADFAIFLDVDITLTKNNVQEIYALLLDCHDDYGSLESRLQRRVIDTHQFGNGVVELFASRHFTQAHAIQYYSHVELQPWALSFLRNNADVYLVSTGPSYFMEQFAASHGIPRNRLICSSYKFCERTAIIKRCDAVGADDKAAFARKHAPHYAASIGVGDSPHGDGPFLAECTHGFLIDPACGEIPHGYDGRPIEFPEWFQPLV